MVQHDRLEPAGHDEAVHDLAETADAGDDDGALVFDLVGFRGGTRLAHPARDEVVEDEAQRREKHGHRDGEQDDFADVLWQHARLPRERHQHEPELASLRERQGEKDQVPAAHLEGTPEQVEDRALQQHHRHGQPDDGARRAQQYLEVDARAHGDEEEPQQQALEGLDVGFQLVPELAVGQHDTGEERPQSRREAHEHHKERDAGDDQQGERGVHLAQARGVDEAEERADQVDARQNDQDHRPYRDERDAPGRQPLDDGHAVFGLGRRGDGPVGLDGMRGPDGEQRQKRQDRDHRDVLRQEHRKRRSPAMCLDQPLFAERLKDDGR